LDLVFIFNITDYRVKPLEQLCYILNHRGVKSLNEFFNKKEFISEPLKSEIKEKYGK